MSKTKGCFITLEGGEGVGKSTQVALLREYFAQNNIKAVFTREPGGTLVGERIRDIILSKANAENLKDVPCPVTELLLYQASRSQLVSKVIAPAVSRGEIIICDRFIDSTTAYQGYGRGLSLDLVDNLNKVALNGLKIDLTFFIDVPPKYAFLRKAGMELDRIDSEPLDFHQRVYDGFKALAAANSERICVIEGCREPACINKEIIYVLKAKGLLD